MFFLVFLWLEPCRTITCVPLWHRQSLSLYSRKINHIHFVLNPPGIRPDGLEVVSRRIESFKMSYRTLCFRKFCEWGDSDSTYCPRNAPKSSPGSLNRFEIDHRHFFLKSPGTRRSANWRRIRGELGSHYFSSKNVFKIILWLGRVIDNMNQGICTWERQLRSKTTAENVLCFHNFWWICFDFSENLIEK